MKLTTLDELKAVWKESERIKFEQRLLERRQCKTCGETFVPTFILVVIATENL